MKTPPTPPEPIVAEVATIFPTKRRSRKSERRVAAQDPVGRPRNRCPSLGQHDPERADDRSPDRHRRPGGAALPRTASWRPRSERTKRAEGSPRRSPMTAKGRNSAATRGETARRRRPARRPSRKRTSTVEMTAETTAGPKMVIEKEPDDDLEDEERGGDRRVVGAGHAGRHAAGRQDPNAFGRDLQAAARGTRRRPRRSGWSGPRAPPSPRVEMTAIEDGRAAERRPQPDGAPAQGDGLDELRDPARPCSETSQRASISPPRNAPAAGTKIRTRRRGATRLPATTSSASKKAASAKSVSERKAMAPSAAEDADQPPRGEGTGCWDPARRIGRTATGRGGAGGLGRAHSSSSILRRRPRHILVRRRRRRRARTSAAEGVARRPESSS